MVVWKKGHYHDRAKMVQWWGSWTETRKTETWKLDWDLRPMQQSTSKLCPPCWHATKALFLVLLILFWLSAATNGDFSIPNHEVNGAELQEHVSIMLGPSSALLRLPPVYGCSLHQLSTTKNYDGYPITTIMDVAAHCVKHHHITQDVIPSTCRNEYVAIILPFLLPTKHDGKHDVCWGTHVIVHIYCCRSSLAKYLHRLSLHNQAYNWLEEQ